LENKKAFFPGIGKSGHGFFQGLEKFVDVFPGLGKL
jgi:hypothetical protein